MMEALSFPLCFLGFFGHMACRILFSRPGMEPGAPAVEAQRVLTTGPPGKSRIPSVFTDRKIYPLSIGK